MKKLFVLICFILFAMPGFAEYLPIPKEKSAQYKAEIETTINEKIPVAYERIDTIIKEAKQAYLTAAKNPYNKKLRSDYIENLDVIFDANEFDLYLTLIEITSKYVAIKNNIPNTGHTLNLAEFIYPYLKDNNINYEPLTIYGQYSSKQEEMIRELFNSLPNID